MDIKIEDITPSKAEAWLNQNKSNRKMRDGVAEKYADDMKNGRWTNCPEPISFYVDGDLADGQHRLWAILESGTTQRMPVARGLEREDGLNLNTGLGRSLIDNARISGVDTGISAAMISAARAIADGAAPVGSRSNAAKLAVVEEHREAATWASSNVKRVKLLSNSVVLGAVGRAWYHEADKDKLRRFCDVLGSGFSDGASESAAIAIRNYILAKGAQASSSALWRDSFLKVQNAIHYFMQGKKLSVIKGVADEAYPLKARRRRSA
ncbi:hypothetical protein [Piscinibacter gummiphilus]|uniref:ParB/Sulfiredoxin domain-containing protein n=1 Tax=Piscinibacter gummiphilus TaxID=946333 RepID=A0ABZ0CNJ2_9BURK|nr:hypothetical protein [Piscinibacter gummiphilus]WOB06543.1 hypothetical protein RXV79_16610 [Piscinibacter gummiphilus]